MESVAVQPTLDDASADRAYRDRILKTLTVFPELSLSMLHTGIGPSLPSKVWKPVLMQMVEEGVVALEIKIHDGKSYQVYSLAKLPSPEHTLKTS